MSVQEGDGPEGSTRGHAKLRRTMSRLENKNVESLARGHALLWNGLPQSGKGPKPSLSLEQILTAAIAIADDEGIDALSMRRLAKDLEVGAMSLYRYVPGKLELLSLMLDQVMALPVETRTDAAFETEQTEGWLRTLELYAWQHRARYLRHPWFLHVSIARPMLGPNSVAELERIVAELRTLPLSDREKIALVTTIDGFVTGTVQQRVMEESAAQETGISDEEFWERQAPHLIQAMESGRFPVLATMSEDMFDGSWEQDFAFGLRHLLNGFKLEIAARQS
ncbi:TetR/AcrR family transcriptional regulator [uncultured Agrococcus sp.]|uniref:TetR/AcrR family transcriptional regulator n=1 Tax=uncultured Agrococcus sp. TaxID=382258 RepID=UPI0025E90677|nr:TetR/AcrR family transcriptional regulator [uncultured Agrococcus sp.]